MPEIIILILTHCFLLSAGRYQTTHIIYSLGSASFALIIKLKQDHKWTMVLFGLYLVLCQIHPIACYFLPLLVLEIDAQGQYDPAWFSFVPLVFQLKQDVTYLFIIVFNFAVLLFKHGLKQYRHLLQESHVRQDAMTEKAWLLKEQHDHLKSMQDDEIKMATLNERNRISRDLHDSIGHLLSSALLQTGAIQIINQQDNLRTPLEDLKETLKKGLDSTHQSIHQLYDTSIDLNVEIHHLTQSLSQTVDYRYQLHTPLPNYVKREILTIFKEAIHNIQKHSNATEVTILIHEQPAFLQFSISDNGTAIQQQPSGIGLDSIYQRVQSLEGHLTIQTKHGFQLFFTIPKGGHPDENLNH